MAEVNCTACEEIRQTSPEFVVNGFTDDMCNSFANDTGLSTTDSNDDYTDLTNLNDCLVGNMATEIEAYDVCDWKDYMRKFVPNLWTTLKAMICTFKGVWINIHKLWCVVNLLTKGFSMHIGEKRTETSYVVAGKGVSFRIRGDNGPRESDVNITYVGGGLCRVTGSLSLFTEQFWDYDENGNYVQRAGNAKWANVGKEINSGELLYEIRINKAAYHINHMYAGFGLNTSAGAYQTSMALFSGGEFAYGQHGTCDTTTGEGVGDGSAGHLVPDGWVYLQVRMHWVDQLVRQINDNSFSGHTNDAKGNRLSGRAITPRSWLGINFLTDEIDC